MGRKKYGLISLLREGTEKEKLEVLKSLYFKGDFGKSQELIDVLLEILYECESPELLCWSAALLTKNYKDLNKKILPTVSYLLIKNLDSPDIYVRASMLLTLGNILGEETSMPIYISYAGRILSTLRDNNPLVKTFAMDAISNMIEILPEDVTKYIVPEVLRSLESDSAAARAASIYISWKILRKYPDLSNIFIPKLLTLLYTSSEDLRIMIGLIMADLLAKNN